ncbi:hypothetical protein Xbed_03515 [Xenorhabdus beddingii]|uniref:Uncharacterized protein n=1 Tax=Xenorhabdus beddingii TaxID=40578 RepID=A0A1Y2SBE9_9GAMM|nr:hypothetical protein [Xenorhabdus beddingii]OTA16043.1 hypothetical protein Xbed_03515 [Xenorhabdus beddingii]
MQLIHTIHKKTTIVRIVATMNHGSGLSESISVDVFKKNIDDSKFILCGNNPHPEWRQMSVNEYIQYGRPEKFKYVTHAEIIRVVRELRSK